MPPFFKPFKWMTEYKKNIVLGIDPATDSILLSIVTPNDSSVTVLSMTYRLLQG